jgi:hypothetical protein
LLLLPAQVGKATVPDSRFDNIGWALLTTFQLVTTENWNNVMYSGMAATSPAAALWFIAAIIIGNYVLLNLFLAVLLENFGSGSGSPSTSGNGGIIRSNSSGSTLAAAAKAALLLSWMKDLLETSWIAKLVNGPNSHNRVHALARGSGTRSGEDWGDSPVLDSPRLHDAAAPAFIKTAAMHAASADASVHLSTVSVTKGRSHAASALKQAELEVEPSAWSAQGSFTLGTLISPRGMPDSRRYVAAACVHTQTAIQSAAPCVGMSACLLPKHGCTYWHKRFLQLKVLYSAWLCRFAALVAPPREPSQLAVPGSSPGSFTAKFAVARSGGSVPRFSRLAGVPVNSGFGVEASGGSYSAALLQGNLKLLLERNSAAANGLTAAVPPCAAAPAPGLPVVSFSSGSMLPQEQQRGVLNARGSLFGGAAAAAGVKSAGGRSGNLGASGYWVSVVYAKAACNLQSMARHSAAD